MAADEAEQALEGVFHILLNDGFDEVPAPVALLGDHLSDEVSLLRGGLGQVFLYICDSLPVSLLHLHDAVDGVLGGPVEDVGVAGQLDLVGCGHCVFSFRDAGRLLLAVFRVPQPYPLMAANSFPRRSWATSVRLGFPWVS